MPSAAPPVYLRDSAPSLNPPRFGLLSAGELVDWNDPHLYSGVEFVPNPNGEAAVMSNDVDDHTTASLDTLIPTVVSGPIHVVDGLNVPTTALAAGDADARARALLSASEVATVEKTLWTDADHSLTGDAVNLTTTAVSIAEAVGLLEEWFGARYGGTPVLHAPRRLGVHAHAAKAAYRDGAKMTTPLGSTWSFGNYPGTRTTGPLGTTWLVATGQVQIRRSDVEVRSNTLAATLHRTTNQVRVSAHRTYVVSWDGIAAAVPITV